MYPQVCWALHRPYILVARKAADNIKRKECFDIIALYTMSVQELEIVTAAPQTLINLWLESFLLRWREFSLFRSRNQQKINFSNVFLPMALLQLVYMEMDHMHENLIPFIFPRQMMCFLCLKIFCISSTTLWACFRFLSRPTCSKLLKLPIILSRITRISWNLY